MKFAQLLFILSFGLPFLVSYLRRRNQHKLAGQLGLAGCGIIVLCMFLLRFHIVIIVLFTVFMLISSGGWRLLFQKRQK